jgi:thiamine biosynthesis lipoprotein
LQLLASGGVIRGGRVYRAPGVHLDLGGVAKGWIADRAAALLSAALDRLRETRGLPSFHSVLIDTDGDLSLVIRSGRQTIAIGIPDRAEPIGWLDLPAGEYGVATSGVGVHHWGDRHHLIDPRTGAPAASGVVQATVVAASARCAEAHAKAVVIGGAAALRRAEQDGIERMVLIDHADRILSTPAVELHPRVRFTVA